MNVPTMSEIAQDKNLWGQYVDPQNNDPEAFNRMTVWEKVAAQREMFLVEAALEDAERKAMNPTIVKRRV